jgi:hypothetical protein
MDVKMNPRINFFRNIIVATLFQGILQKKGLVNKLKIPRSIIYLLFKIKMPTHIMDV